MDYTVRTRDQLRTLLVAFRKAGKLTQAELAAKLGVTQQALSALEGEPSNASFERILNLLSALSVDIILRPRRHPLMVNLPQKTNKVGQELKPYTAKPAKAQGNAPNNKRKLPLMVFKRDEW